MSLLPQPGFSSVFPISLAASMKRAYAEEKLFLTKRRKLSTKGKKCMKYIENLLTFSVVFPAQCFLSPQQLMTG